MSKKVVQSVDRDSFEPMFLDLYWQFICERQWVWYRRVIEEKEAPWTEDPILRREFFTNVYRNLDPGTHFVVTDVLDRKQSSKAKLLQVMFYRLTGSQMPTLTAVQKHMSPDAFDKEMIIKRLRKLSEKSPKYLFGDSYRVAAYAELGGKDKIENITLLFEELLGEFDELFEEMSDAEGTEKLYRVMSGVRGFGEFLAYQVVLDLIMPNSRGKRVFEGHPNDWAIAGPGARKGLWAMLQDNIQPANMLMPMEWLRDNQDDELERLGLEFPYLVDEDDEVLKLTTADIQTSLCEYFKYVRIWKGEMKSTRIFTPANSADELPEAAMLDIEEPEVRLTYEVPKPSLPVPLAASDSRSEPETPGLSVTLAQGIVVASREQIEAALQASQRLSEALGVLLGGADLGEVAPGALSATQELEDESFKDEESD